MFGALLETVQQKLARESCSAEVQAYVAQVLTEQQEEHCESLAVEANKRGALLKYVKSLEVCHMLSRHLLYSAPMQRTYAR